MADILITFGRVNGQLEDLGNALTFTKTISGTEESVTVPDGYSVVTLLPGADCWVAGGNAANAEHAETPSRRRPLVADVSKRFACRGGQTISVVQRS